MIICQYKELEYWEQSPNGNVFANRYKPLTLITASILRKWLSASGRTAKYRPHLYLFANFQLCCFNVRPLLRLAVHMSSLEIIMLIANETRLGVLVQPIYAFIKMASSIVLLGYVSCFRSLFQHLCICYVLQPSCLAVWPLIRTRHCSQFVPFSSATII